jgi:hypothetical protein
MQLIVDLAPFHVESILITKKIVTRSTVIDMREDSYNDTNCTDI